MILEQPDVVNTCVHQPSHLMMPYFCPIFHFILHDVDNRTSSFLYNEASLPAPSNLTQHYGTDVAQSANGNTSYVLHVI